MIPKSSRIRFFIFNSTVHTTTKKKPHQETLVTCQCNVGGNWAIFSTKNESQGNSGPAKWTLKRHPRSWDLERPTQFPCLDCSEWPWIRLNIP
jgi:hypothetical protein